MRCWYRPQRIFNRARRTYPSMDLLTPARTWATAEISSPPVGTPPSGRMPRVQRMVMLASVVGPFLGLLIAITLLLRRGPAGGGIGWPEVVVMITMYALAGFGVTIGFHRLL